MRTWISAALGAVALIGCAAAPHGRADRGGTPPDFALEDLEGELVRLSDHLGEDVVLINFWATWCNPCAGELPHLQRLYETYEEDGFVVLAIAIDGPESVAEVAPMVHRYGLTFPVLVDDETRVVGLLNPRRAAPYNVLIDRKGRIVSAEEGYSPGDERALERMLRGLL